MVRASTLMLGSGALLGVAAIVVYALLDNATLAGLLMFVALTDGIIGTFLRRADR